MSTLRVAIEKEHLIPESRIRALRTASLVIAGLGASATMSTLGSWWTPLILLIATAGALLVVLRTPAGAVASRALVPVLIVVVALTVAGVLGALGVLPNGWVWAALGAYIVAWGEYLVSQTIARSRGTTAR
ncbi:hypothetical protein [Microbacterium testaceum]|uniref:Uncharacterized protein n=2 Tax=Microbacteriaceae TaxID=85023 RepID=A0A147FBE6_MICTE|nr:hypothetical protein [Microbacterium testaceum]KTS13832.1 hypothetical protein RSA3_02685 [Microbacterium testaceum]